MISLTQDDKMQYVIAFILFILAGSVLTDVILMLKKIFIMNKLLKEVAQLNGANATKADKDIPDGYIPDGPYVPYVVGLRITVRDGIKSIYREEKYCLQPNGYYLNETTGELWALSNIINLPNCKVTCIMHHGKMIDIA